MVEIMSGHSRCPAEKAFAATCVHALHFPNKEWRTDRHALQCFHTAMQSKTL